METQMPDTETLPTRETGAPTHTACTIALSQLVLAKDNPRAATDADEDIEALAVSILDRGILQPIIVTKAKSKYHIRDGRRRWLALKSLQAAGHIDGDYQVSAVEVPASYADAGLIANILRRPMSDAEIFRAVAALSKKIKSPERIGRALGLEVRTVRQFQALGALPEAVLAGLADETVDFDSAKLLCQIKDPARRAQFCEQVAAGDLAFYELQRLLRAGRRRSDEYICRFVTEDGYRAARGEIVEELFEDWAEWISPEAVEAAFVAAVAPVVQAVQAFNLANVRVGLAPDMPGEMVDITDLIELCDEAEAETINAAYQDVMSASQTAMQTHLADSTPETLKAAMTAFVAATRFVLDLVPEETRGGLTAIISFRYRLDISYHRAITELETAADEAGAGTASSASPESEHSGADTSGSGPETDDAAETGPRYLTPSKVLTGRLHEIRTRLLAKDLVGHADVALALLIAQLAGALGVRGRSSSPLLIGASVFSGERGNRVLEDDETWAATQTAVTEMLTPPDGVSILSHILDLEHGDKMNALAFLVARTLDLTLPTNAYTAAPDMEIASEIAGLIQADPSLHWTPDAETLGGYTKGALEDIADEIGGAPEGLAKKSDWIEAVETLTAEAGWLPPEVRLTAD